MDVLASNDVDVLRSGLQQQHNDVVDVDVSLAETVGSLKDAMMAIIKRKKQEDAEYNDEISNSSLQK